MEHKLMETDERQHDHPENVTRNIGIKGPDEPSEACFLARLQFLFASRGGSSAPSVRRTATRAVSKAMPMRRVVSATNL